MPDRYRRARGETVTSLDGIADDEMLTLQECGHILRIGYALASRLADSGDLPSVRVSPKNIRVRAADLRAYIDGHLRGRRREKLFPKSQRAQRAT